MSAMEVDDDGDGDYEKMDTGDDFFSDDSSFYGPFLSAFRPPRSSLPLRQS